MHLPKWRVVSVVGGGKTGVKSASLVFIAAVFGCRRKGNYQAARLCN